MASALAFEPLQAPATLRASFGLACMLLCMRFSSILGYPQAAGDYAVMGKNQR